MIKKIQLILLAGLLSFLPFALSKETKSDQINYLDLAALMLKDDNLERSKIALSQVDINDDEVDMQRFYTVSGLLYIRTNENKKAIENIQKAKELGKVDAVINVYLAQAAYGVQNYTLTLQALDDAGDSIAMIPSIYLMRSQSYWSLKKHDMSIATLEQAEKIFPNDKNFPRRKIFYYLELGYNKQAAELGMIYLQKFKAQTDDYVAIGNALRTSGDKKSAMLFLESAHLKFPLNENIAKSLAAVYIQTEHYYSAAKIIHDAALINPLLIKEAAELYRRAGSEYMALTLNGMIGDQQEKFKQRLALMLQLENFEQAIAMEDDIKRVHLDTDENILYALAYAFFKVGDYKHSEHYLSSITNTDIFQKATELRKIMADCETDSWRCQ